ncbi:MAG: anaerobic ribonucleoside-triphosphate reductase activating protein [Christensenellaceae bacterium]|jgi:anaerobic ribonucleoside-triphosphate reductase activating protein|nr:anaerobic ribonucleoside-triphosphate reductase activating protein [Christensenellaceae bacterium]
MQIRLSGVVYDSIVDGPGLRAAIFTQGCPHACPGCHNPLTHDPAGGYLEDTDSILAALDKNPLARGITLTGGEPFEQPAACLALARGAHALGKDVWAFSGYTLERLRAKNDPDTAALLEELDVLVDGPFILKERSLDLDFRGSKNQRVLDMRKTGGGVPVLWQDPWKLSF